MARIHFSLEEVSKRTLARIVKRGENWRERERAETLLLLGQGFFPEVVADMLGIHVRTVGTTRNQWMSSGLASLPDRPRCGAPRKLRPEHVERIVGWAQAQPLTAAALLARHTECGGPDVHLSTLHGALKTSGLWWKRTRHSLKKVETRQPSGKQP